MCETARGNFANEIGSILTVENDTQKNNLLFYNYFGNVCSEESNFETARGNFANIFGSVSPIENDRG